MASIHRKKVKKVKSKLDKIASKGKDNEIEYYKYVDELIDKGQFSLLQETQQTYFGIIDSFNSVYEYKKYSWKIILRETKPSLLIKLSKLFKEKKVYQTSFNIFSEIDNKFLGEIKEKVVTTDNFRYYVKNHQYARLIGERMTFLEVYPKGKDMILINSNDDNVNISEENNLVNRYRIAIDVLLDKE